ncbi:type VI secretion system baseplate subunit TssE (plasmid) [Phyllobacterium sp. 628]|uniref:type VI secretion system baseplate subunit TssE n=1 Tax=Phyllobacterium sp. 628 TaxID=2718938 RepID=UPI0016626CD6|nr:type VI secretion system baseplate subunit TssE [Phyllobacterium sp. 628]QND55167.1 type VI secretion system baseplate subunit TssE [Phyllobacterium sp. 628]
MAASTRISFESVVDRLMDFDPDMMVDQPTTPREQINRIRESVRRDIESLLNSQQWPHSIEKELEELETSLLRFGTPGFHGLMLATTQQRLYLAEAIRKVIVAFDPRLARVRVGLGKARGDQDRVLDLRIEAEMLLPDGVEPIVFDTSLDPSTRHFLIGGPHHG